MLVVPEDLRELAEESGSRFQRFVTALVLNEATAAGLNPIDIDADYRTSHPDGGCDIFVAKGQSRSTISLIPLEPSIWSIKAGTNGINPNKLASELQAKSHPRLRQHLKDGHVFFWCALEPAGQNERQAMRIKADKVAKKIGVEPTLIRFVWNDHLATVVNRYPNLFAELLPHLYEVIRPMATLEQWKVESPDKKGLSVPFVNIPGSHELQERIKTHLLGTSGESVFHIAGLSGIGKTRTTIEACLATAELSNTLYIGSFAEVRKELWRRLHEPSVHIRLIIDEVPLEQLTGLQERFATSGDRIRIVSIGPAPRGQARRQRDLLLQQLEPPNEATGVLPIVEAAAPDLTSDVRRSIAHYSSHDLRLALLLVDATRRNGEFSTAPLRDFADVWKRIVSLFPEQIRDAGRFQALYELLTLAIDIGHSGEHRAELKLLASFFSQSESDIDGAIRDASECGLGDRLQSFFEAKPTALAIWLFQERLWPLLSPRLDEFVKAKPSPRLFRRFLERCQETASPFREEVESQVGAFFLKLLGNPQLQVLSEREASRIFQTWAEFDPERGLEWLEHAVVHASNDQLRQFSGDPDGSGGWRGRRQIVWLCEHLACFSEHFDACERMLFRLAQVETEDRIANNSTNTWREMFLPLFANTQVPFQQRLGILDQRLRAATMETIDLVLSAFFGAIERFLSRMVPLRIVGGRIVPDQWKPRTSAELELCRLSAAKTVLATIPALHGDVQTLAVRSVVNSIAKFLAYETVDELRAAITPHLDDESLKRQLLSKLEEWLSWQERDAGTPSRPGWYQAVRRWRDDLTPTTLAERLRDLTSRDYWSVYRVTRRRVAEADPDSVYAELARELLQQPGVVREAAEWFGSPEAMSAPILFLHVGLQDSESKVLPTILAWLQTGFAVNLVANYLRGVWQRAADLPTRAIDSIDDAAKTRPAEAIHITILADPSNRGLARLMANISRLESSQRAMLRQLSVEPWKSILDTTAKKMLLQQFCEWADSGDRHSVPVAIDIFGMWRHGTTSVIPQDLVPVLIRLAELSSEGDEGADDHGWKEVMEALAPVAPHKAAELLADEITNVENHRYHRAQYAQEVFTSLAKEHPEIAMEAIGKWVLDGRRGVYFRLFEFRGLFDAIGLETVRPWVEKHGTVAAIGIARHVCGPSVEHGVANIPALADWLLSTYQHVPDVFNEFAMGRHSGEMRSGHARDREAGLEQLLSHFEGNPKQWVRKWIDFERENHRREVEWHDQRDEEDSRL